MPDKYSISNVDIVTPSGLVSGNSIKISGSKIEMIGEKAGVDYAPEKKCFLYPALVNVHDHLRGNYIPKVGPEEGTYYLNWSLWDMDLKAAPVYQEREKNTVEDLYLLSAYKNLFSGVVTVNDHFPHELNEPYIPLLPVRVIKDYTLSHACSSFALNWGDGIEVEHKKAVEQNLPFIIHCEEGFDEETQSGIDTLEKLKCLDHHNVLIHCIGFTDKDIKTVKKSGASTVWCPNSNMFMFNVTCKIRKILAHGINACIGTDATHSGGVNLLDEMKFAADIYRKMYKEELDPEIIFKMVTINPARAIKMDDRIGTIEKGKLADLLLLSSRDKDPYKSFLSAEMEDIELLIQEGNPVLGHEKYRPLFEARGKEFTEIQSKGRVMLVKGDPLGLMKRIRKAVGFKKSLDFIPIDEYSYT